MAGLCLLANAVVLESGALLQPAVLEQLWWTLGLWALLRRALDDQPAWWLPAGLAFGLGLLAAAPIERVTLSDFVRAQRLAGPALLVACIGLLRLLRDRAGSGTRTVGLACAAGFGVLLALHGKASAAAPMYPVLYGAGASQLSQWGESLWQRRSRWLVRGLAALQVAYAVVVLGAGL